MEPSPTIQKIREKEREMYPVFIVTEVMGLTSFILLLVWICVFMGGFAWNATTPQFNWHPFLMFTGFVFIYGHAMILYRVLLFVDKFVLKIAHTIMHTVSIVLVSFGLYAQINLWPDINRFTSVHSWLGLTTISVFVLQFIVGFVSFLFPQLSPELRAKIMPAHRFLGATVFGLAILTCATGVTEQVFYGDDPEDPATDYSGFGLTANFFVISMVLYAIGIGFLVLNPDYKRENMIISAYDQLHMKSADE